MSSKWFTEGSLSKPTGDWRWRIGMFSSRPILQILVRREPRSITTAWVPPPLIKFAPFLNRPRTSAFEYRWRDITLQDLSSAELRPLMSGRRSEANFGHYPAIRSNIATILVNGKPHAVAERPLTVADIVDLAYGPNPDRIITDAVAVTARERGTEKRTITSGETIDARDGLILNVVTADNQCPSLDDLAIANRRAS
jgi:Multiubiquitin